MVDMSSRSSQTLLVVMRQDESRILQSFCRNSRNRITIIIILCHTLTLQSQRMIFVSNKSSTKTPSNNKLQQKTFSNSCFVQYLVQLSNILCSLCFDVIINFILLILVAFMSVQSNLVVIQTCIVENLSANVFAFLLLQFYCSQM